MKKSSSSTIGIFVLGAFVRFWLTTSEYQKIIADRVEVSTPLNSWKHVTESLHLLDSNIDVYTSDVFHESPLHLLTYKNLINISGKYLHLVFILSDLLTASLLYLTAKKCVCEDSSTVAKFVAAAYMFGPYTIFNCVGFTTTVFGNLFMASFLTAMAYEAFFFCTFPLALCVTQNLYPILLIAPLFLQLVHKSKHQAIAAISAVFINTFGLVYLSYKISGNWGFLSETYGFILNVPNLRPNIGLFWYFFTEMFEHFEKLFIYTFQINISLLYLIPLSIRFRNNPMLLAVSLLSLIAIFKSYPCLGDVGFVLSLLPSWKHLFKYTQHGIITACCFLVTTALAPSLWYLWIYCGSANANFYFGVTLAFEAAQIFLLTDILFAYMKEEFFIKQGWEHKVDEIDDQLKLE